MDNVADMLTIIRNGYLARKPTVSFPISNFKYELAKTLENHKYVGKTQRKDNLISVDLIYVDRKPKLKTIKKISKQGLRVYSKSKHLKTIKGGRGDLIISTPKGVMSAKDAKKKKYLEKSLWRWHHCKKDCTNSARIIV